MVHKLCENHLIALYDAVKNNDISELEVIEHELTEQEECVACAYAFKSRGLAKNELMSYLKSQGFAVEAPPKEALLDHFYFWFVRVAFFVGIYLIAFSIARYFFPFPWTVIVSSSVASGALLVFAQLLN